MASILIDKNGKLEYYESVNTGDYVVDANVPKDQVVPLPGVVINPDKNLIETVGLKYLKIKNGEVLEMTKNEKKVVDDKKLADIEKAKDEFQSIDISKVVRLLVQKGVLTKEEIYG